MIGALAECALGGDHARLIVGPYPGRTHTRDDTETALAKTALDALHFGARQHHPVSPGVESFQCQGQHGLSK